MNNAHSNPDKKHQPRLKKASAAAARELRHVAQAALRDERGQIIPWVLLLMFMFLGMCALVVDIGHGFLVKRELQASADAAALAAARELPNSDWQTVGQNYSAMDSAKNDYADFSVPSTSISVTGECSTTIATQFLIPCSSSKPNAVVVTETATIPAYFTGFIGIPTLTVSATSTASKGSKTIPLNVALIIDTTGSMNTKDSSCKVNGKSVTSIQCAKNAVQVLLGLLDTSIDYVSIFTFPGLTTSSVGNDSSCSSGSVTSGPYTFPTASATTQSMPYTYSTTSYSGKTTSTTVNLTYQVTSFSNDYNTGKTSSSSSSSYTLNTSSSTAIAAGGVSGCTGMQVASSSVPEQNGDTNGYNTYFASVIYAADAALLAEQSARYTASGTTSTNVIVILSDGNATATDTGVWYDMVTGSASTVGAATSGNGTYPSLVGECGQAVAAAASVSTPYTFAGNTTNTQIFTVAYGSPTTSVAATASGNWNNGNCSSDVSAGQYPNITPCQTMQQMSHGFQDGAVTSWPADQTHFYSDFNAPGGSAACQAAAGNSAITDLNSIFADLISLFRASRLVPNGIS